MHMLFERRLLKRSRDMENWEGGKDNVSTKLAKEQLGFSVPEPC